MGKAILLATAAGFFTAASSTCQRRGAARAPGNDDFSVTLILRLIRDPVWLLGIVSLILGFACQAVALHFGSLALVQPILASEMLFVFGFMALLSPRRLGRGDVLAALAMAVGLGAFLFTADPYGGRPHAPAPLWLLSGVAGIGLVVMLTLAAVTPLRRGTHSSGARRAALLGAASGVTWGYLAAVIKELGSHVDSGVSGLLTTWSLYVLLVVGIGSMILSSNALRAGPLAASQPGFTIVDPLVASLLGVFIFRDRLHLAPFDLGVEIAAACVLIWGVVALSHSNLVHEGAGQSDPALGAGRLVREALPPTTACPPGMADPST